MLAGDASKVGAAAPTNGGLLSVTTMNVQGLTRSRWGTEADTLGPLLSGLCRCRTDVACLQELGLLSSDVPELQSRCYTAGFTAFIAPLSTVSQDLSTSSPSPSRPSASPLRRVLGHGTLILIRNELAKYAATVSCSLSHRLVAVRLFIRNVCRLILVGIYAPTGSSANVSAERRALLAGVRSIACDASALSAKLIVLGDLNEVADPTIDASPPLTVRRATPLCDLLRSLMLQDTFRVICPQRTAITWQPPGATGPARRLDYIFAAPDLAIASASVEHMNSLIQTDHGVVSCAIRLDNQLPPVVGQYCELLLDPSRTHDWGIEGEAASVCFTTTPSLSQSIWDSLVPLLITALDTKFKPCEPSETARPVIADGLEAAVASVSNTRSVNAGKVYITVDCGTQNAAATLCLLALDGTSVTLREVAYKISAVTSTGWAAFSRAVTSVAELGKTVLQHLTSRTGPAATKADASAAMGVAFTALSDTIVGIAYPLIATRQTGKSRHTRPARQTARIKLQQLLRQVLALMPKAGLGAVTPEAARSIRELHDRRPALQKVLPTPPLASANDAAWDAFRTLVCSELNKISSVIKAVGATERKDLKQRAARQRRADFEAARFRAFLDAAEDRHRHHSGITCVTVPDAAGLPSISTDPETVKSCTRDFMCNWTRLRGKPPSDVDVIDGPAAAIHTSREFLSAHPEVAVEMRPLPWVRPEWFAGLRAEPSPEEFDELLRGSPSGTAPGPSQLSYDLIKHLPAGSWREVVRQIVCAALRHRTLPAVMKRASIWLIPKSSEPCPPPERCRPISLLEVLLKLTEALPVKRLQRVLARRGILCPLQYGFSGGGNTTAPLHVLAATISHARETNADLDIALADSKQAFDRPPPWAQRASLARIGLPEDDIEFFSALQAGAESVVQTAYGATEPFVVGAGFRQGSLNGPAGFNIFEDPLLQMQVKSGIGYRFSVHPHPKSACTEFCPADSVSTVPVLAYVDDTTALAQGSKSIAKLVSNHAKFCHAFDGELHPAKSDYSFLRRDWQLQDYENHAARYAQFCELVDAGHTQDEARKIAVEGWDWARLRDFPLPPFADVHKQHRFNLVPMYQAMRSLGCWFSLDGSTLHQERVLRDIVVRFCSHAQRKRYSILEMRYLLSTVLVPKIVYAARVQLPPPSFLAELDSKVADTIVRSCNLHKSTSRDALYSQQGFGFPSLADLSTAAAIEDIYTLLSDDWLAELRVVRAEDDLKAGLGKADISSTQRATHVASLTRIPQTAITARLQSIAQALAIPGNPLSYPFDKSMWSSLRAPYAARVWEAMAARGYELHSRLPGLRNDPRCMLADVLTAAQYQRISPALTRAPTFSPAVTCMPPSKPLWTLSDVTRPDGLGLRSLKELTGMSASSALNCRHGYRPQQLGAPPNNWYCCLQRYLGYDTVKPLPPSLSTKTRLSCLQPGNWRVALDRETHREGDVVCVWRPSDHHLHITLRVFIVEATDLGGKLAGLSELTSSHGFCRWRRIDDEEEVPLPLPHSLRDVGVLPTVTPPPSVLNANPSLTWLNSYNLIPLVGGWERGAEDDDSFTRYWIVPHPAGWLKFEYDNEFVRRSENLARTAAGDEHPIRRMRAYLDSNHSEIHIPRPTCTAIAAPNSDVRPESVILLATASAAELDNDNTSGVYPLGAAVAYTRASDIAAADDDANPPLEVELATRLDPGAIHPSVDLQNRLRRMADLSGVSLCLTVASSMRRTASVARITLLSSNSPVSITKLCTAPIDRRRLNAGASDASNMLQIYCLLQKPLALPRLEFANDSHCTGALARADFRARRAAYKVPTLGRDYPPSSDWCIVERGGERVNGRISSHVVQSASSRRTDIWAALPSQGRVLRCSPNPLPTTRATALARAGKGPASVAKCVFRSITNTHTTRHELSRWSPTQHATNECWLPGCSNAPDSQDHALLSCPATASERAAVLAGISLALRRIGPPYWWLALPPGRRHGGDALRVTSTSVFASSGVVTVAVAGAPLALIRLSNEAATAPQHPVYGCVAHVNTANQQFPPQHLSMEALSTWCSAAHNAGHTWTAIPDQVLCNATFRWQTTEAIDHLSQHPDALLKALAETALIPGHGSAPGWATLHHTVIDILFDTLGVSSYLGAGSLLTPRRSVSTVLAPEATATPLNSLIGCRTWSLEYFLDAQKNHGILALLPTAHSAGPVLTALTSKQCDGGRSVVLLPWSSCFSSESTNSNHQAITLSRLLLSGFRAAAILPPRLVPTTALNTFGPGLYSKHNSESQYPVILLVSWSLPARQLASALVALTAMQEIRDTPTQTSPGNAPPQSTLRLVNSDRWRIGHCDTTGINDASYADLSRILQRCPANRASTCIVGSPNYAGDVFHEVDVLRGKQPENYLFPHLLEPLPVADTPKPTTYIGASVDDNVQPPATSACIWMQRTNLTTLAAGVAPAALHDVIMHWIQRRHRSRPRKMNPLQPVRVHPPQVQPQPTIDAAPAQPQPLHESDDLLQRPQKDAVSLITTTVRGTTTLWNRHNALTAQLLTANGLPLSRQRRRQPRRRPASVPNPVAVYRDSKQTMKPRQHPDPVHQTLREAPAPESCIVPVTLPGVGRIRHPGKDPGINATLPHG